jgi:DNA-binding transcriptional LysR family regulator
MYSVHPLLELRHLRCFLVVAQELNFRRAAERLRISQQQVSRTIQDLEEIVGPRLFDRTTRRVRLSNAGSELLVQTEALFRQIQHSMRRTQQAAQGHVGKLTVSFSGFAIESSLPKVFQSFQRLHPGIELEIREQNSGAQLESLYRGEIDAGFAISPPVTPQIEKVTLLSDHFILIVPASMRQFRSPCDLKKLSDYPFILVPRVIAPGFHEQCARLFTEAGFTPHAVQQGENIQTLLGLVSLGVGATLGPSFLSARRREGVRYIRVNSEVQVELALISRRDNQSAPLLSLRQLVAELYPYASNTTS